MEDHTLYMKPLWDLNVAMQRIHMHVFEKSKATIPNLKRKGGKDKRVTVRKFARLRGTNKAEKKYEELDKRNGLFEQIDAHDDRLRTEEATLEREQAQLIIKSNKAALDILKELKDPPPQMRKDIYAVSYDCKEDLKDAEKMSDKLYDIYEKEDYFRMFNASNLGEVVANAWDQAQGRDLLTTTHLKKMFQSTTDYYSNLIQRMYPAEAHRWYKKTIRKGSEYIEYIQSKEVEFSCDMPEISIEDALSGNWTFKKEFKYTPRKKRDQPFGIFATMHEKLHFSQSALNYFYFKLPKIFQAPPDHYASTNLSLCEALGDMFPSHRPKTGEMADHQKIFDDFFLFHRACISYLDYMHHVDKAPYSEIKKTMNELGMPDWWVNFRAGYVARLPVGYIPVYYSGLKKTYKLCGTTPLKVVGEFPEFQTIGGALDTLKLLFASGGANLDHITSSPKMWETWVKYLKDHNPGKL